MASKLIKLHNPQGREMWIKADAINFVKFPIGGHEKHAHGFIGIGTGLNVKETPAQINAKLKKAGVTFIDD